MCGISGVALPAGESVSRDLLVRMNEAMPHRGPDGEGIFVDGNVGLGHRRLSIIDLEGGAQPLFSEDESITVVANGEIYNYRDLTEKLATRGHQFRTRSDIETLVHLYEDLGIEMLAELRGMFAFALYDRPRRELYVVRDRFGIKPVYYCTRGGGLYFASEIKPLLQTEQPMEVNRHAVHLYLQSRFAHADETIFKGIFRLPEGCFLRWRNGQFSLHRYYSNPVHESPSTAQDCDLLFEQAFSSAVKSHMVSDVPVGAYLGGGVDSSMVVSEMSRLTGTPVRTFCVDFEAGAREATAAEETANALGCKHETILCGVDQLLELPKVIYSLEEPVGDGIVVAQYCLSRATRRAGVKVVLTGDGADETLGGYQYLRAIVQAFRWAGWLPPSLVAGAGAALARHVPLFVIDSLAGVPMDVADESRKRLDSMLQLLPRRDVRALYDLLLALHRPDELKDVYTEEFLAETSREPVEYLAGEPVGRTLVDRVLALQYRKWLPANINLKQDKLSMAHSVENRVPFLDHCFVELVATLPDREKIDWGRGKRVLRRLARKRLRASVANAKKKPFHLPLEHYLGDRRLWGMVEDNVESARVRRRGIVRVEYAEWLKERARGRDYLTAKKLLALVILELWFRMFVDKETP